MPWKTNTCCWRSKKAPHPAADWGNEVHGRILCATCLFLLQLSPTSGCSSADTVSRPPDFGVPSESGSPPGSWELVWSDEFDGAAGTPPDSSTWTHDIGTGTDGWGNLELQSYTSSPSNVAHDGDGGGREKRTKRFGQKYYKLADCWVWSNFCLASLANCPAASGSV